MRRLFTTTFYKEVREFFTSSEYTELLPQITLERTLCLLDRVEVIEPLHEKEFEEIKTNNGLLLELGIILKKIKTKEQLIQAIESSIIHSINVYLLKPVYEHEFKKANKQFPDVETRNLRDVEIIFDFFNRISNSNTPILTKISLLKIASERIKNLPQEIATNRQEIFDLRRCREEHKHCTRAEGLVINYFFDFEKRLEKNKNNWLIIYKQEKNKLIEAIFTLPSTSRLRINFLAIIKPSEKDYKELTAHLKKEQEKNEEIKSLKSKLIPNWSMIPASDIKAMEIYIEEENLEELKKTALPIQLSIEHVKKVEKEYLTLRVFSTGAKFFDNSYFSTFEKFSKHEVEIKSTISELKHARDQWIISVRDNFKQAERRHLRLFKISSEKQAEFDSAVNSNDKSRAEKLISELHIKNNLENERLEQEEREKQEKAEIEKLKFEIKNSTYSNIEILTAEITKINGWLEYNESKTEKLKSFSPRLNILKVKTDKLKEKIKEIEQLKNITGLEVKPAFAERLKELRFTKTQFESQYSEISRELQQFSKEITELLIEIFNQKKSAILVQFETLQKSVQEANHTLFDSEILNGQEDLSFSAERQRKQNALPAIRKVSEKMGGLKNSVALTIHSVQGIKLTEEQNGLREEENEEEIKIIAVESVSDTEDEALARYSQITQTLTYPNSIFETDESESESSTPTSGSFPSPTSTSSVDDKWRTPSRLSPSSPTTPVSYKTTPEEIHTQYTKLESCEQKIPGLKETLNTTQTEASQMLLDHCLNHPLLMERLRQSKILIEERINCYKGFSQKTVDKRRTAATISQEYTNLMRHANQQDGANFMRSFQNLKKWIEELTAVASTVPEGNCFSFHSQTYTEHDQLFVRKLNNDFQFITQFLESKNLIHHIQLQPVRRNLLQQFKDVKEGKDIKSVPRKDINGNDNIQQQLNLINERKSQYRTSLEKTKNKRDALIEIEQDLKNIQPFFVEGGETKGNFSTLFEKLKSNEAAFTKAAITENHGCTLFSKNTWHDYGFITQFQEAIADLESAAKDKGLLVDRHGNRAKT